MSGGLAAGAVAAVAAAAGRRAEDADAQRRLHPEVVAALIEGGFTRHFVPARWGGTAGSVAGLLDATATVARECVSAAWCASLAAGAARMGAYLPERGQAELWADGPDVFVAGALIPSGTARRVDGGWRVSGEWDFTSGADHAGWVLAAAMTEAGDGARPWFFAVPGTGCRIKDTWFTTGMRGTGSNTVLLDDVFVPEHRGFDREDMLRGRSVGSAAPCHTAPLRAISGILFAAPALGGARGALEAWTGVVAPKARAAPAGAAGPAVIAAETTTEVDLAGFLLRRVAEACDRGEFTGSAELRHPYDCAAAVDRLVDVVERLFRTAGSRGQLAAGPLQRFWRDLHCLASHVALRPEPAAIAYGGRLLEPALPPEKFMDTKGKDA